MSYLRYMSLLANSGVQHILCCVFDLFYRPVYPMFPVSLGSPFLMVSLVFSSIYSNRSMNNYYILLITRMNLSQFYIQIFSFLLLSSQMN
jgi:hypothetical protein